MDSLTCQKFQTSLTILKIIYLISGLICPISATISLGELLTVSNVGNLSETLLILSDKYIFSVEGLCLSHQSGGVLERLGNVLFGKPVDVPLAIHLYGFAREVSFNDAN